MNTQIEPLVLEKLSESDPLLDSLCKGLVTLASETPAPWAIDRTEEQWKQVLIHSDLIVAIYSDGSLVGFVRALSDRTYRALVNDVMVHPRCQKKGFGKTLMKALLSHTYMTNVERTYLFTNVPNFYVGLGFTDTQKRAMVLVQEVNEFHPA